MRKVKLNNSVLQDMIEDAREILEDRYPFEMEVLHSSYRDTAFCSCCHWKGSYNELEANGFICPHCQTRAKTSSYAQTKHDGALLIDLVKGKKDGEKDIIAFRFIGFDYGISSEGIIFDYSEEYRILTDGTEYALYRNTGSSFVKMSSADMRAYPYFNSNDIFEHHYYAQDIGNHKFEKELDVLYETDIRLNDIFTKIALLAAKTGIEKTCPTFNAPLPSINSLSTENYDKANIIVDYAREGIISNTHLYHLWCGHCGKYYVKSAPADSKSLGYRYNSYARARCSCGRSVSSSIEQSAPFLHLDVQKEKNCSILRFCEFLVTSSVMQSSAIVDYDANIQKKVEITNVYYVCCYSDQTVLVFDRNGNPMTHLEIDKRNFATKCTNPDVYEILKNDAFITNTGYPEFTKLFNNYSIEYFFGCTKTEISSTLTECNLHSLIFNLTKTKTNLPAYLSKKSSKFSSSIFSKEQISDFALNSITLDNFVSYMQILKKDSSVLYSDFLLLYQICTKSAIMEIYRKIPNIKFASIISYITRLNQEEALSPAESIPVWSNYLKLASQLGIDLSVDKNAFPDSLRKAADILSKENRENSYTDEEKEQYRKNAEKVSYISYTKDNFSIRPVKDRDELRHFKDLLLTAQSPYRKLSPNGFSLVVFNNRTQKPEFVVDIDGDFVDNQLISGQTCTIYSFGGAYSDYRRRAEQFNDNPVIKHIYKQYNIL